MTDADKALEQSDVDDLFEVDGDTEGNDAPPSEPQETPPPEETKEAEAQAKPEQSQTGEQEADPNGEESPQDDPSQQARHVPLAELLSERDKGRKKVEEVEAKYSSENAQLRNQLAQLQGFAQAQAQQQQRVQQPTQQQAEPDFYEDPQTAVKQLMQQELAPIQNMMRNQAADMSERLAINVHGKEAVDSAFNAVSQAGIGHAFLNSTDPYGEMVTWHNDQLARQEIGSDLNAYKERLKKEAVEEALAGLKNGGQPQPTQTQPTQPLQPQRLPGTLADATDASVQGEVLENGQDWMDGVFK